MSAQTNPRRLVALAGLRFALFPIPVITLFWKDQIGMSLTDIMVLQSVFGVAVAVLEFPSGYFADRAGYRTSLLVGAALWTVGWLVYAAGATFRAVMAAEVLLGAGLAFVSGTDSALLWASLEASGRAGQYTRWEARKRAAGQTSEAASAAAGGWLYSLTPRLPLWLQVPVGALALVTVASLRDVRAPRPIDTASHLARALRVGRHVLWRHRGLQTAIALSVVLGLSTFVMVWLIQPWMQARGIPPAWFGPLWAAAHVWLAGVSLLSGRVVEAFGVRPVLLACALLVPLGYAGLAVSGSAWGVAFYLCFMIIRGLQGPTLATVMQRDAPPEDRATALSLASLVFRLTFIVAGPPIGALIDRVGMEPSLGLLAAVLGAASLAALGVFSRAHRR